MNEILTMNSRSPRRKFVFLCCVTLLELIDKKTFGINMDSPQGQESKRFSLFYKVKEGVVLTGHIISVHQTRNVLDCTHKCLSNPECASFNFEIQQSRFLSICELNNVSSISSNHKLKRKDSFVYYEPLIPKERPKQQIADFYPTTSNIITKTTTTRGTQEVSTSQDQAATLASRVPSIQRATTAAPVTNCGQQWHAYKSGCLRLFDDHKNWVDANQHCATFNVNTSGDNGRLISIFSQDENNQIVKLRSSQGFLEGEYYIGLSDLQGTGTYKWVDGTNVSFTNWNTGFPQDGKGVVMKMSIGNSDNGKWLTRNYNDALRFICECPDGRCA
ncbi:PREDICTED: tetranectin-like isoform X2 [Acropora digitifera]|uniref:tetranectin-like isoform X2 n=1 Tax=Acropora digitifera TaxID=70779 RepID=UPI00077B22AC|nr:PREDICTED: tetranectin-like isoform X2 [Acropora digitifera]